MNDTSEISARDEALKFLIWLRAAGPWALVAIAEGAPLTSKTFGPTTAAEMKDWVKRHNTDGANIYYHVNTTRPALTSKAKKEDILQAEYLFVDIDPVPDKDLTEQRCEFETRVLGYSLSPSAVIYSGNGVQALWRLDEPIQLAGDPKLVEAVEVRNRGLIADLDADTGVFDVCRILRLPGTINWPNKKKRDLGRTQQSASLVALNDGRHAVEDFPAQLAKPPVASKRSTDKRRAAPKPITDLDELDKWEVSDETKRIICDGEDKDDPDRWSGDRSKAVFAMVGALLGHGVPEPIIVGVLTDAQWGISGHVRDQSNPVGYAWRQVEQSGPAFARDRNGKIRPDQGNIRLALDKLGVRVRYNEFKQQATVEGLEGYGPRLDDDAQVHLRLLIEEKFRFVPAREYFADVVRNEARKNAFHPLRERLVKLTWDGVPRIETWLIECAGAEDTPYVREVSKLALIAAVRRIMKPGSKFDEMVILESEQGQNKSSALKTLALDEEYFLDGLPLNADSKLILELTPGKWIVEFSELAGLRKSDIETVKHMLSRRSDTARLAYARMPTEIPRQWIGFGTTNAKQYLRDPTGNRRFWPVRVQKFDLKELSDVVEQLWAEAVDLEQQGATIRLNERFWESAAKEQAKRELGDPFFEKLEAIFGRDVPWKVRASDVLGLLEIETGRSTRDHPERIASAMQALGFETRKRRFDGQNPVNAWARGRGDQAFDPAKNRPM